MNLDVVVEEGEVADVAIDFDACKSIVPRGSATQTASIDLSSANATTNFVFP